MRVVNAYILVRGISESMRFSFFDNDSLASPPGLSNKLNLFLDDTAGAQSSGGTVDYLRVFNGALNANEVNALYLGGPPIGVPEPSTYAMVAIGILTVTLQARRRRCLLAARR